MGKKCPTQGSQYGHPADGLVQAITFLPGQHFLHTLGCAPEAVETPFSKGCHLVFVEEFPEAHTASVAGDTFPTRHQMNVYNECS